MRRVWSGLHPVLLALASIALGIFALPRLLRSMNKYPGDGLLDWKGARLFFEGHSPYTPEGLIEMGTKTFGHPPTTPFWFLPLAHVDEWRLGTILGLCVLSVLFAHLLIVALELRIPRPHLHALLGLAVVINLPWIAAHLEATQISELIAFFYVLAWYQLRRGRDLEAGMALGLATTFKLFPALLIAFFLLARRWRVVLGALASYVVVAGIMTTRYGAKSWYLFFTLQGPTADLWISRLENGSLWGIVARLFHPGCVAPGPIDGRILLIGGLLSAALLGFAWRASRAALTSAQPEAIDLPFALVTLVSLFLNPWVWEHYFVFYLLPASIVANALWRGGLPLRRGEQLVVSVCLVLAIWTMRNATGIEAFKVALAESKANVVGAHLRLHRLEIAHWIIGPLLQLALFVLLRAARRRAA